MNRRITLAATVVVAALGLVSCADDSAGQLASNRIAAQVGESQLDQDDLAAMLSSELGQQLLQAGPIDGVVDGNSARGLLSAWVGINAILDAGIGADVDRAEIESSMAEQYGELWTAAPPAMKDLAISNMVVGQALESGEVTAEELQELVSSADVGIDSRYGWWDGEQFSVQPFG